MSFEKAIDFILSPEIEGGYVFDSNDPGGETKWGISKRQYPNLDIKNLQKEDAEAIYEKDFWVPLKMDQFPVKLQLCLLDAAINHGGPRAIRMIQGAVGACQDGQMGPETLEAVKIYGDEAALANFLELRLNHYKSQPGWDHFGAGWVKRLLLVSIESLRAV